MSFLTICQDCEINPAMYGDGLTWARCPECHWKHEAGSTPSEPEPVQQEAMKHEIKPGLISIILPVYMKDYALFHYTGNCIGSIREHTTLPYELIVIDNGSPIKVPSPNAYYADKVIQNQENLGVTHAWNQGIRVSQGEHIVLLNNDVQVFGGWEEGLLTGLSAGYDLVMAHPMYSLTEPFARATESARIKKEVETTGSLFSKFKDFSCVMFNRSLVDSIGLFDEAFFNYCSDSDFFDRMEMVDKKWACCEVVATSHLSDATGFAIPETPEIMNKDKARYEDLKKLITSAEQVREVAKELVQNIKNELPYRLVRTSETGDAIFLIEMGHYHQIQNPETLNALGFQFGDEKMISYTVMVNDLQKGEVITMDNYQKYV